MVKLLRCYWNPTGDFGTGRLGVFFSSECNVDSEGFFEGIFVARKSRFVTPWIAFQVSSGQAEDPLRVQGHYPLEYPLEYPLDSFEGSFRSDLESTQSPEQSEELFSHPWNIPWNTP